MSFEVCSSKHGEISRFAQCDRHKQFLKQSNESVNLGRRLTKGISSGLSILASITVVIWVSGTFDTAIAAEDPRATVAKSSQDDPLDVPGSFKDLPDAKDAATAKRSPEEIRLPASTGAASAKLAIDAEKGAATTVAASFGRIVPTFKRGNLGAVERYPVAESGGKGVPTVSATDFDSDLIDFHATAYCLKGRTASGIDTRPGVIAADPRVLPLGTVVHVRAGRYTGIYTVMDTGSRIRGRIIDVYVPTHREAKEFGRRQIKLKVIGRSSAKVRRTGRSLVALDR